MSTTNAKPRDEFAGLTTSNLQRPHSATSLLDMPDFCYQLQSGAVG